MSNNFFVTLLADILSMIFQKQAKLFGNLEKNVKPKHSEICVTTS